MGAFFTQIADERIGGTYITFLNTVSNFGGTYPKFFIFYFVDKLTIQGCKSKDGNIVKWWDYWSGCDASKCAEELHGTCSKILDGYYVIAVVCLIVGLVNYKLFYRKQVEELQAVPREQWRVQLLSGTTIDSQQQQNRQNADEDELQP